ncbi:hypothetical protein ACHAW6_012409, partial [Cyclotella cf. meneghiniana]
VNYSTLLLSLSGIARSPRSQLTSLTSILPLKDNVLSQGRIKNPTTHVFTSHHILLILTELIMEQSMGFFERTTIRTQSTLTLSATASSCFSVTLTKDGSPRY